MATKRRRNGKKRTLRIRRKQWFGGTGDDEVIKEKKQYIDELLELQNEQEYADFLQFLETDPELNLEKINYQDPESNMTALYFIYQKLIYYQPEHDVNSSKIYITLLQIFTILIEKGADLTIKIGGLSILDLHKNDQNSDIELLLNPLYELFEKYYSDKNLQEFLYLLKRGFKNSVINRYKLNEIDKSDGLSVLGKTCKLLGTLQTPQIESLSTIPLFNVFKILLENGASPIIGKDEKQNPIYFDLLNRQPFNMLFYIYSFKCYITLNIKNLSKNYQDTDKNKLCNSVLKHFPNFRKQKLTLQNTKILEESDDVLSFIGTYNEAILKTMHSNEQEKGKKLRNELYDDIPENIRGNIPQEIYLQHFCSVFLIIGFLTRIYEPICQIILKGGKALQLNLGSFSSDDLDILIIKKPVYKSIRKCKKNTSFNGITGIQIINILRKCVLDRQDDMITNSDLSIVEDIANLIIYFTTPNGERPIFFQKHVESSNIIKISFNRDKYKNPIADLSYGYDKIPDILKHMIYEQVSNSFITKDFDFLLPFFITTCITVRYMRLHSIIFEKLYYFHLYKYITGLSASLNKDSDKMLRYIYDLLKSKYDKSKLTEPQIQLDTYTIKELSDYREKIYQAVFDVNQQTEKSQIQQYLSLSIDFYYDLKRYIDFLEFKKPLSYYYNKLKRQLKEIAKEIAPGYERMFLTKLFIWYNDVLHNTREYFAVLWNENLQLIQQLNSLKYYFTPNSFENDSFHECKLLKSENNYFKNVLEYVILLPIYNRDRDRAIAKKKEKNPEKSEYIDYVPPYNHSYELSFLQSQIKIMKKWLNKNKIQLPHMSSFIQLSDSEKRIITEFDKISEYVDEILTEREEIALLVAERPIIKTPLNTE
jgi:hypothetical protein